MKLYLDAYGKWWLGSTLVNFKVMALFTEDKTGVAIYSTPQICEINKLYNGLVSGLTTEAGVSYGDYAGLMAVCSDFFEDTPIAGFSRNLFIAKAKVTISDGITVSLFSPNYAGRGLNIRANTLKAGDMFIIETNGLFTTTVGATSVFKILFGATELFGQSIEYVNNRLNYVISQRILMTFREVGTSGVVILQGFTTVQTSETQFTSSVVPIKLLAPVAVNTTIDNLLDMNLCWGGSGHELIVSNAIVRKLRA